MKARRLEAYVEKSGTLPVTLTIDNIDILKRDWKLMHHTDLLIKKIKYLLKIMFLC